MRPRAGSRFWMPSIVPQPRPKLEPLLEPSMESDSFRLFLSAPSFKRKPNRKPPFGGGPQNKDTPSSFERCFLFIPSARSVAQFILLRLTRPKKVGRPLFPWKTAWQKPFGLVTTFAIDQRETVAIKLGVSAQLHSEEPEMTGKDLGTSVLIMPRSILGLH